MAFNSKAEVQRHIEEEHLSDDYHVTKSAFSRAIEVVEKVFQEHSAPRSVDHLMQQEEARLIEIIRSYRHRLKSMKTYFVFVGSFVRKDETGMVQERVLIPMQTKAVTIVLYNLYQVKSILLRMANQIKTRLEIMEGQEQSNLIFDYLASIRLNFVKIDIAGGGEDHVLCDVDRDVSLDDNFQFVDEIPLQTKKQLAGRHDKYLIDCVSHIQDGCFLTAFAQAFLPSVEKTTQIKTSSLKPGGSRFKLSRDFIEANVNYSRLKFPTPIKQLRDFENLNSHLNFALNVFLLEKIDNKRSLVPLYRSKNLVDEHVKVVNLLIVKACSRLKESACSDSDESDESEEHDDNGIVWGGEVEMDDCTYREEERREEEDEEEEEDKEEEEEEEEGEQEEINLKYVKVKKAGHKYKLIGVDKLRSCKSNYAHFLFINDLSKLVSCLNKPQGKNCFVCCNCMHTLSTKVALSNHQRLCFLKEPQSVKLPAKGDVIKFKSFAKTVKLPLFACADFETTMHQSDDNDVSCVSGPMENYTKKLNQQQATTCSLVFVSSDKKLLEQRVFSAPDNQMPSLFYKELRSLWELWSPRLNDVPYCPQLTAEENAQYSAATHCYLCNNNFVFIPNHPLSKVRDHSHSSLDNGKFLGAAHQRCNVNRRRQTKIKVFMHNFKGFDSMFVLQGLSDPEIIKDMRGRKKGIRGLPDNTEHFKSLDIYDYTFLDSFAFLGISLEKLVQELGQDYEFPLMKQMKYKERKMWSIDMKLLTRKSIYPYEFAKSFEQLESFTHFPDKSEFFSVLTQDSVSEEDYLHGSHMYEQFECQNMLEYTEIYCLIDSLLLAECLSNYRDLTYNEFSLDMCHYVSSPQLSYDIMLKETDVELELLSDIDMVNFIETSLRGGLSYVNERHVKLPEDYDVDKTKEWLLYVDSNNLYGFVMMDWLPTNNYRWLNNEEFSSIDWKNQLDKQSTGYILECDLSIPTDLHDYFSSNPLASEKFAPIFAQMSTYSQKTFANIYGRSSYKENEHVGAQKLCGTLLPKERYILHYSNLRLFLQLGIKLDKVHRVLSFEQRPWLKDYIIKMTRKRLMASSEAMRTHYKLLINSLYGKFIQQVRNYLNSVFATSRMTLTRHAIDSRFEQFKIIGEQCVVFYSKQKEVVMDKAYIVGFSILEKSKFFMSDIYYNKFLPALGGHENCSVVMSDTDSFMLHGKNLTKNEALERLSPLMDFSNYPKRHPLYNDSYAKIPGYFKDESMSNHIIEVAAIRSKNYNHSVIPGKFCEIEKFKQPTPKCKGISKVFAAKLTMDMYRECLGVGRQDLVTQRVTTFNIRSYSFQVSTIESLKLALSAYDNKRYILNCGIHSLPYGHYKINLHGDYCLDCKIDCKTECHCKLKCKV